MSVSASYLLSNSSSVLHNFFGLLSSAKDVLALTSVEDQEVSAQEELQDLFPDTFVAPFYLLFFAAAVNCITNLIFNLVSEWREERKMRALLAPPPVMQLAPSTNLNAQSRSQRDASFLKRLAKSGNINNKGDHESDSGSSSDGGSGNRKRGGGSPFGTTAQEGMYNDDDSDDDTPNAAHATGGSGFSKLWKRLRFRWMKLGGAGYGGTQSERVSLIHPSSSINDNSTTSGNPFKYSSYEGDDEVGGLRYDYGSERPVVTSCEASMAAVSDGESGEYLESAACTSPQLEGVSTQHYITEAIAETESHARATGGADFATSAVDGRAKGLMYSPAYAFQRQGMGSATYIETTNLDAPIAAGAAAAASRRGVKPIHNEKRRLRRWYYLLMHPNQMFITISIMKAASLMMLLFYHIQSTGGWDRFVVLSAANIFSGQLSALFSLVVCKLLPVHRSVLWSSVFGWVARTERRPILRRSRSGRNLLAEREAGRNQGQMHSALAPSAGDEGTDVRNLVRLSDTLLHPDQQQGGVFIDEVTGTTGSSSSYTDTSEDSSSHRDDWEWDHEDGDNEYSGSRGHSPMNVRFGICAPGFEDDGFEVDGEISDPHVEDDYDRSGDEFRGDAGTDETVTTPSTPDTMSTPSSETSEESIEEFKARITPWMQPRRDRSNTAMTTGGNNRRRRVPVKRSKKKPSSLSVQTQSSDGSAIVTATITGQEQQEQSSKESTQLVSAPSSGARAVGGTIPPTATQIGSEEEDSGSEEGEEEEEEESAESNTTSSEEFSEDEDEEDVLLSWRQRQRHQRSSSRRSMSSVATTFVAGGGGRRSKSCCVRCCPTPVTHILRRARKNLSRFPRKMKKWCSAVASLPDWVSLDYIFLRYDYLNLEDLSYVFTHGTVFITVSSFILPVFLWFVIPGLVIYFWLLVPIPLLTMVACRVSYRALYVLTVRHSRRLHNSATLHTTSLIGRFRAKYVPSLLVLLSSAVLGISRVAVMGIFTWAFQAAMIYSALFLFKWDGMTDPSGGTGSLYDINFSGCSSEGRGPCLVSLRESTLLQQHGSVSSLSSGSSSSSTPIFIGHLRKPSDHGNGSIIPALFSDEQRHRRRAHTHVGSRYIAVVELELRARLIPVRDYFELVLDGSISTPSSDTPTPHPHPHPTKKADSEGGSQLSSLSTSSTHLDLIYLRNGAVVVGAPVEVQANSNTNNKEGTGGGSEEEGSVFVLGEGNASIPDGDIVVTPFWMRVTLLVGQVIL